MENNHTVIVTLKDGDQLHSKEGEQLQSIEIHTPSGYFFVIMPLEHDGIAIQTFDVNEIPYGKTLELVANDGKPPALNA